MPPVLTNAARPLRVAPAAPATGGVIICPKCKAQNPAGAKFCAGCGATLSAPSPKFCPKCGDPVKAGEKFCDKCGAKLV